MATLLDSIMDIDDIRKRIKDEEPDLLDFFEFLIKRELPLPMSEDDLRSISTEDFIKSLKLICELRKNEE